MQGGKDAAMIILGKGKSKRNSEPDDMGEEDPDADNGNGGEEDPIGDEEEWDGEENGEEGMEDNCEPHENDPATPLFFIGEIEAEPEQPLLIFYFDSEDIMSQAQELIAPH